MQNAQNLLIGLMFWLVWGNFFNIVYAQQSAQKNSAEIVSIQGSGEYQTPPEDWQAANAGQALSGGNLVRTGALSRMAILFSDGTQMRLSQNALLEVKSVRPRQNQTSSTTLLQRLGRSWTRSKTVPDKLFLETPSATASIRGTEWEMAVAADGTSTLTVLQGSVEFYNDQGRVNVAANEQAVAQVGQAPVKLIINNPRDRVQWVGAYALQPLHHIRIDPQQTSEALKAAFIALDRGDTEQAQNLLQDLQTQTGVNQELLSLAQITLAIQTEQFAAASSALQTLLEQPLTQPAAYLIMADLLMYQGETEQAIATAKQSTQRFPNDAAGYSTLATIYLYADRPDESREAVTQALQLNADSVAAQLAQGNLAKLQGDAAVARQAYLTTAQLDENEDRAWFGLGQIDNEQEYVRRAREYLDQALELNPDGPGYQGELGTLLTLADDLDDAEQAFAAALADNPGDYVALTGLGILKLKRGDPEQALEQFLKAGVMEPRYARANLYAAVAYYQQGQLDQALAELAAASSKDPKDPLPYFIKSIIHNDYFEIAEAVSAAREALRLMPNLKSLNQLFNDQRGTANLGSAFASFGLEEWALNYAQESYYPYWAGSHLFLADRYTEPFLKSSELFQGFLADTTVFGASPRFQTILSKPGHYGTAGFFADTDDDLSTYTPTLTLNGYANNAIPTAYFFDFNRTELSAKDLDINGNSNVFNGAFGIKPSFELGLFGFASHSEVDLQFDFLEVIGDEALAIESDGELRNRRLDLGAHYKFSPVSQIWLKAGMGDERLIFDDVIAAVDSDGNFAAGASEYSTETDFKDLALRHTVTLNPRLELSWGAEYAEQTIREDETSVFLDSEGLSDSFLVVSDRTEDESWDGYISARYQFSDRLLIDAGLFLQHFQRDLDIEELDSELDCDEELNCEVFQDSDSKTLKQINPRFGIVYEFAPNQLLRFAYQDWTRPASTSTLGPVSTAGIPLSTEFSNHGGNSERARLQLDWEWNPRLFSTFFIDYLDVENILLIDGKVSAPRQLNELERLRNRLVFNLANESLLEDTPEFFKGEIKSAGGAVNVIFTERWSGYLRYIYADSENTDTETVFEDDDGNEIPYQGNKIPFVPEHTVAIGASYVSPARVNLNMRAIYRSERFEDEENEFAFEPGWSVSLNSFWETRDKRFSVNARIDNILDDNASELYGLWLNYRF